LIYTATFTSLGLLTDPLFFILYHQASATWDSSHRSMGWIVVTCWYLFTKIVKRIGLLRRNPYDLVFIPVSIIFGLAHGLIKLNALWTWNVTCWGNRPDGDVNDNERMSPTVMPSEVMVNPAVDSKILIRYTDEVMEESDEKDEIQTSTIEVVD